MSEHTTVRAVTAAKEAYVKASQDFAHSWGILSRALSNGHSGTHERKNADVAKLARRAALTSLTVANCAANTERDRRADCYEPMLAALEAAHVLLLNHSNATREAKRWEQYVAVIGAQCFAAIAAAKGHEDG